MSTRKVASVCIALALTAALAWLLIPPFPAPAALIGDTYADLVADLGPPTGSIPTKFVAWQKSRGVAIWTLEATYGTTPIGQRATPGHVSRCLWIHWAGVAIFCQHSTQPIDRQLSGRRDS